ncbi:MAG TPA: alcohol dehydrogenase catalytic domain-containing protein [Phenylobacterium sp.]|uniref:alcohol dehydrogenase catalytic domain-containing protein n=1 Tax=Phenylobacterium sp. TaxID=1871053 RepID=UPI002B46D1B1|nr:alcohol dehydrogenase catalytic domain-containing protein [Phenylobacterium sp.]HKR90213.1 alcohol dehydrogenase catalytic domain-containing protein [Phenylobacterium sp.]
MRAARLHRVGEPLSIDIVERPIARPTDVVIEVMACGVVPNMINVLNNLANWSYLHQPDLPAIYGLDVAGVIVEKGSQVHGMAVGDRVYVNPGRYCGACRACRSGNTTACKYYMLNGYFGMGELAQKLYDDYPYGGFAEFMSAPQYSLVKLPHNVSFETAARWGYLGTGYAALRRAGVNMTSTVLINGITGTLGLGTALFALALGARKVLGVGRNAALLQRVRDLHPDRIHVRALEGEESIREWARSLTDGDGVDVVVDALPTGAPAASFQAAFSALGRGGRHVNIGSVYEEVPINFLQLNNDCQTMIGSLWFTTEQGQEMAELAATGGVRLDVFENEVFALEEINSVLSGISNRHGGFSNYLISPNPEALTVR